MAAEDDEADLIDLLAWLGRVGGMMIFRDGLVHVYRGPVLEHKPCGDDPVDALRQALSQARDRWTAEEGSHA